MHQCAIVCLFTMEKSQTAKFLSWNLSRVTEIFCRPKIKQDSLTKMASSRSGQHRNEFIALMAAYLLALTTLSTPLSCLLLGLLWLVTGKEQWGLGLYKDQKLHLCCVTIARRTMSLDSSLVTLPMLQCRRISMS